MGHGRAAIVFPPLLPVRIPGMCASVCTHTQCQATRGGTRTVADHVHGSHCTVGNCCAMAPVSTVSPYRAAGSVSKTLYAPGKRRGRKQCSCSQGCRVCARSEGETREGDTLTGAPLLGHQLPGHPGGKTINPSPGKPGKGEGNKVARGEVQWLPLSCGMLTAGVGPSIRSVAVTPYA